MTAAAGMNGDAGLRIVVADDNADAADALGMLLGIQGYEVRVARDGEEAVRIAGEFRPAMMLLDIGMPRLDGYGTAAAIRAQPWGAAIRLIALTGYSQPADRERARKAGFDEFVVKPVDSAKLDALCRLPPRDAGG